MNLSSADMPKFECEEFSDQGSSRLSTLGDASELTSDPETDLARSEGLCSDCANREDCAWRMPEGGVWHCEEYC
jgi:hypothetical protein